MISLHRIPMSSFPTFRNSVLIALPWMPRVRPCLLRTHSKRTHAPHCIKWVTWLSTWISYLRMCLFLRRVSLFLIVGFLFSSLWLLGWNRRTTNQWQLRQSRFFAVPAIRTYGGSKSPVTKQTVLFISGSIGKHCRWSPLLFWEFLPTPRPGISGSLYFLLEPNPFIFRLGGILIDSGYHCLIRSP